MTRIWQWTSFAGMASRPLSLPLSLSPSPPLLCFLYMILKGLLFLPFPKHLHGTVMHLVFNTPTLSLLRSFETLPALLHSGLVLHWVSPPHCTPLARVTPFLPSFCSRLWDQKPISFIFIYPVSRLMDYSIRINLKTKQIKILKISLLPRWNLRMVKLWKSASFHIICYVISDRAESWVPANRDI